MYKRHKTGKIGENEASNYLLKNRYKIMERNFKCKFGEIDIIAFDKNKNEYVFIEVKTRNNFNYGRPIEAVNKNKQRHILLSSEYYIFINNLEKQNIRFDIITIYKNKICHYKNCEFKVKLY